MYETLPAANAFGIDAYLLVRGQEPESISFASVDMARLPCETSATFSTAPTARRSQNLPMREDRSQFAPLLASDLNFNGLMPDQQPNSVRIVPTTFATARHASFAVSIEAAMSSVLYEARHSPS